MSKKQQILKEIRSAKRSHLAWVSRAELLAKGYPVTDDQVPLSHIECAFGSWYLEANTDLQAIGVFKAIDIPHKTLHDAYADIFKALFEEKNVSFFGRLIGTEARLKEHNKVVIAEKLRVLDKASAEVIKHLEDFEQFISKIPDLEAEKLFS